ncbi:MAG: GAF domain-containing protein, partial [Pyrinomonadaceae bacterium]
LRHTKESFSAAAVSVEHLRLLRQMERALGEAAGTAEPAGGAPVTEGGAEAARPATEDQPLAAAAPSPAGTEALGRLLEEVRSVLLAAAEVEMNDIVLMVLEALYRGCRFDRVLFCLTDQTHAHLRARLGLGERSDDLVGRFDFPVRYNVDPVGPVMISKIELFVERVKGSAFQGSEFAARTGAASFGLVPLVVRGRSIGCLYFDRLTEPLGLTPEHKRLILELRDQLRHSITRNEGTA